MINKYIFWGNETSTLIGAENDLLDEVRMYPADARMKTFTYEPLLGVTSMMDENGITVYYEYDKFGRLKAVRNDHRNIVKSNAYHYASED